MPERVDAVIVWHDRRVPVEKVKGSSTKDVYQADDGTEYEVWKR